jgi:hypothetical protein
MVIFIIKNLRDIDVEVGTEKLKSGGEFSVEQLNNEINAAGEKGDISITVTHEHSKVAPLHQAESYSTKEL